MIYKEFGSNGKPSVILLHGGGLSAWSLEAAARELSSDYLVVTPVLGGHGEDGDTTFHSIAKTAEKLLCYIDERFGGSVFALYGLSIGAQIVAQTLAKRLDVARFAVIESALVCPIRGAGAWAEMMRPVYGLTKKRWFAKWQAKALCVPDALFEKYYQDSMRMSEQTLVNMVKSNSGFALDKDITRTSAEVLVLAGEKEKNMMKRSAIMIQNTIPGSELKIIPNMKHGEFSMAYPHEFASMLRDFFAATEKPAVQGGQIYT
jgi:pimeloyl-ACP methyl ester carboxylesterase